MNKGDLVMVITGCKNCGDVPGIVHDVCHDKAYVEIIGTLPHGVKEQDRGMWIEIKKLRLTNE